MPASEIPLAERIQSSFRTLSATASELNLVSDELGKCVADLDTAFKKLNLGISVWVHIYSGDDDRDMSFWSQDLGYAKIGGKWGIALRTVAGDYQNPDEASVEEWLFNESPRHLRLSAIGKIPELLEKLSKEAAETAEKIKGKLAEAQEVAAAVKVASEVPKRVSIPRVHLKPAEEQKK